MISKLLDNKLALARLNEALEYSDKLFGALYPIGTIVKGGRIVGGPNNGYVSVTGGAILWWEDIEPVQTLRGTIASVTREVAIISVRYENGDFGSIQVPIDDKLYPFMMHDKEVDIAKTDKGWVHVA